MRWTKLSYLVFVILLLLRLCQVRFWTELNVAQPVTLQNYLLKWQTSYVWVTGKLKQDQKSLAYIFVYEMRSDSVRAGTPLCFSINNWPIIFHRHQDHTMGWSQITELSYNRTSEYTLYFTIWRNTILAHKKAHSCKYVSLITVLRLRWIWRWTLSFVDHRQCLIPEIINRSMNTSGRSWRNRWVSSEHVAGTVNNSNT